MKNEETFYKDAGGQELVLTREVGVDRPRGQPLAIQDFESVLRYAIEKGAPLQDIMAVRKELKTEADKAAFDQALAAFQAECPVILKDMTVADNVGKRLYSYAPFERIVQTVAPLLQKHGFSFQLDTDTASQDGWVIARCHVTHSCGHCRTSTAKFPIGTGTRLMSQTQVYAAALSFASRRVFCNAFGIVPANEDDDGASGAKPKPQGPSTLAADLPSKSQAQELWNALKDVRGTEKNWKKANEWMWDNAVLSDTEAAPNLTASRFKEATEASRKIMENT